MPDKIHYQQFDSLGRVNKVLVDNDAKTATGKLQQHDKGQAKGIDQVLKYGYNLKGEQTLLERDNNIDGTYDYREAYTLDPNGKVTQKEIDLTNDGQFDKKEEYTKEADGGLVQTHFYNLVDGKEVLTKIEDYELNANNQRTKLSLDTLGDGSINAITRYDLDALGRIEKAYFDTEGDGNADRVESYTKDANGDNLRVEISNTAGEIQVVRTYERNSLGQVIKYEIDNGNDGIIDQRFEYARDEYGNETGYKLYSYNSEKKALELTQTVNRVFNELNQIHITSASYTDPTRNYQAVYKYDDFGRRISETYTGANNYIWEYTYYDDGKVQSRQDKTLDGKPTSKTVYLDYYQAFESVANNMENYNTNGVLTLKSRFLINEGGQVVSSLLDNPNNGNGDGWESFLFGNRSAVTNFNISQDFTTWSTEKLAELGTSLSLIRMGNGGVSELTLNAEVVAKISNGDLRVQGASDKNDVLNLSGFKKASSSSVKGYNLYTATVGEEDLNLYVQANDSITVNILG
ncbi:RHS repeat protein [Mannheimia pernigra]|uniref:RHS repeat protein n=1 Tax=Mannheimia pernigra TaxID=111844 RepID=UPI00159F4ED3|nr:RHS repeat protein [Mannheimia pernigra]QLB43418.1 RHS repeat protein [Mannheimia pernigra]